MNKVIYIGEVPQEYLDQFGNDGAYFEFSGKKFYYELEFNFEDGCATLTDTCGRSMPMDSSSYEEIAFAIGSIAALQNSYQDLQDEMNEFINIVPYESYVRDVTDEVPTENYSAGDMASAAAQGFRDGRASAFM